MSQDNLNNKIIETANGPKSYENDGEKITQHSLPELIEADKHLARKTAARNPFAALKKARISTQGPER